MNNRLIIDGVEYMIVKSFVVQPKIDPFPPSEAYRHYKEKEKDHEKERAELWKDKIERKIDLIADSLSNRIDMLAKSIEARVLIGDFKEWKGTVDNLDSKLQQLAYHHNEMNQGFHRRIDDIEDKYRGGPDDQLVRDVRNLTSQFKDMKIDWNESAKLVVDRSNECIENINKQGKKLDRVADRLQMEVECGIYKPKNDFDKRISIIEDCLSMIKNRLGQALEAI